MIVGRVCEIWRFPVKSMAGERLESAEVGALGIVGDRGWAVRDLKTGEIHNAKRFPILMQCAAAYRTQPRQDEVPPVDITFPDGTTAGSDSTALSERLTMLMGHAVALHALEPAANKAFYRRRESIAVVLGKIAQSQSDAAFYSGRSSTVSAAICGLNSAARPMNRCPICARSRPTHSSSIRRQEPTSICFRFTCSLLRRSTRCGS